jgi:CHASE3 domain sensor protein
MGKYFLTNNGNFEFDGEHEYRMEGQSFYIHSQHNAKPINLQAVERIEKLYREKKMENIINILTIVNNAVKAHKQDTVAAMKQAMERNKDDLITNDDIKFLIDYSTYNASSLRTWEIDRLEDKKPTWGKSKMIMTLFPILMFGAIGVLAVLIMRFFNPFRLIGH